MSQFQFKAVTASGDLQTGVLDLANETAVLDHLNRQGLIPVSVESAGAAASETGKKKSSLFASKGKVGSKEVLSLSQQLSSMLRAGLPLDKALSILIEITDHEAVSELLQNLQKQVRDGSTFADALQDQDKGYFGRFYINMIRAGEAGGSIGDALDRLVDYLQRAKELRGTVISALIYPAILFSVAVVSIIALLTFVVPQFAQLFEDMGKALPTITVIVMQSGDFLQAYWWTLLIGLLVFMTLMQFVLSNDNARQGLDRSLLGWPFIGSLIKRIEMARLSRSLGTLLHNGVPLLKALHIVKNTISNRIMSNAVEEAAYDLKQGKSLTRSLLDKGVFPSYALHMLRVGEETGRMEDILEEIADIYDDEVKSTIKHLLALLEPLLILSMALMILVIIGSVLLPMMNMAGLAG